MHLPDESHSAHGKMLDHDAGIGEVTRSEIEKRARELAVIDGFSPDQVNEGHRYQARQELRGAADADAANDSEGAIADLVSTDDVPGESGSAVYPATNAAVNSDEQTIGEQLYGDGIAEAEHDRMTQSRRQERLDR